MGSWPAHTHQPSLGLGQTQLVDLILGGKVPLLAMARMCGGWLSRAQCYLGSDDLITALLLPHLLTPNLGS